ncbi:MAG TPA: tripartite tricarboxylate transporter substrate binding protein [Hyphomicrobiaceae bacterium]|nr:tripartite tricarboxylate transporter substrate binding protein [Hyphomicrobiaceae bacterium]
MFGRTLSIGLALVGAMMVPASALAQFKPAANIELVVHGGPGSGNDVFGRALVNVIEKEKLTTSRIQVVNKPGGGSATASAYMASKAGDANTLAVFTNVWLAGPLVQEADKVRLLDLTPIALMVKEPGLIVTNADSPYKTLKEFVAAAKEKPGTLKQSGGSITSRDNIIRQMIMNETGADWAFISFPSGGERLAALLGGHVQLMIIDPGEALAQLKSGKLRVLAQVAEQRLPEFKDVPTVQQAGFKIPNVPQARGIVGPPNMPKDAIAYYEGLLEKASKTAAWKKYVQENFLEPAFEKSKGTRDFLTKYEGEIRGQLKSVGAKVVR